MTSAPAASVSTHILDTSLGRPAAGVALTLAVRTGAAGDWTAHAASVTDADGRCKDLPALPADSTEARLEFAVRPYLARTADHADAQQGAPRTGDSAAFFPEVTVVFAVAPGEHYHVPLLLSPFGYSVYRGS
jgi:5-hydroxyisourate hydrolase